MSDLNSMRLAALRVARHRATRRVPSVLDTRAAGGQSGIFPADLELRYCGLSPEMVRQAPPPFAAPASPRTESAAGASPRTESAAGASPRTESAGTQLERRAIISDGSGVSETEPAGSDLGLQVWMQGYASVYAPVDMGDWIEIMMPGAFDKWLDGAPDILSCWNHDMNQLLGRTSSGTLELSCDSTGLRYRCDLPVKTHLGQYIAEMADRGDIRGASIQFCSDREEWDFSSKPYKRFLHECRVYEAGPVYAPAQPLATVALKRMRAALASSQS